MSKKLTYEYVKQVFKDGWCELLDEERNDQRKYPEYIEWRKKVYEKDKYTCQKCNKRRYLNAHHIENYATNKTKRTDADNGTTLCHSCHTAFHKVYSRKDNNQKQLDEFLRNENLCLKLG